MNASISIVGAVLAISLVAGCATTNVGGNSPSAQSVARTNDQHCGLQSASRLPANGSNCQFAGRSYSGEDVDRTGKTSAAEALAILDPSISVGR